MTPQDAYKYKRFRQWVEDNALGFVFDRNAEAIIRIKAMQMLGPDWKILVANDGRDIMVQPPIKLISISFTLDLDEAIDEVCRDRQQSHP